MNRLVSYAMVIVVIGTCGIAFAQTHTTVRHYKERIDETPPEISQAEADIQKKDFAAAEPLLKRALEKDPNNFLAWFDL